MAVRRNGPVLFELLKEKQRAGKPRVEDAPPPPPPTVHTAPARAASTRPAVEPEPDDEAPHWLSPGRTVRMPVGYFFIGVAILIVAFVAGWAIGHQRGAAASRAEIAGLKERTLGPVNDPVLDPSAADRPSAPPPAARPEPRRPASPSAGEVNSTTEEPVIGSDPRQTGLNYLIIAREDPDTAVRAARFLERNGVPVAVFPDPGNPRFHLVTSRQGFPRGTLSSPEAIRLKQEVLRLGKIWTRDERGPSDFDDAYFFKQS